MRKGINRKVFFLQKGGESILISKQLSQNHCRLKNYVVHPGYNKTCTYQ